jgi:hypothetical protein
MERHCTSETDIAMVKNSGSLSFDTGFESRSKAVILANTVSNIHHSKAKEIGKVEVVAVIVFGHTRFELR